VSYAIGVAEPLSIHVDTYQTAKEGVNDKQILAAVKKVFDFRPGMIARNLDMMRGGNMRYQKTAAYGHFGRDDPGGWLFADEGMGGGGGGAGPLRKEGLESHWQPGHPGGWAGVHVLWGGGHDGKGGREGRHGTGVETSGSRHD
jgi:hypothetical protein